MKTSFKRDQLYRQIDILSDDLVEQVADFVLFLLAKQKAPPRYGDWDKEHWHNFSLGQRFPKNDDVTCTIADGKKIYRP